MSLSEPPPSVHQSLGLLLRPATDDAREQAWDEFVLAHSALVLHTCRTLAHDRDAAMDGYAHVLKALREDDYRRLRAYTPDGRTRFTTWLVVVVRRLLVDHDRSRYGRARSGDRGRMEERTARRRLVELVGAEVDPDALGAEEHDGADSALRRDDLHRALQRAIDGLDDGDRLLLAARFEDGRSVREIARMLALPTVFHVYRRLSTVLAALRGALARQGVTDPDP